MFEVVGKNELLGEVESYFGTDSKRINHARQVLAYAEKLLELEPDADREVVVAAAVLHDIGIHEAEKKHESSAGRFQEIEGPPIARKIMETRGVSGKKIEEVCDIIAHHHTPGKINTLNFKVLYDADWLVNLGDEYNVEDRKELEGLIGTIFLTEAGKEMAEEIYLKNAN